MTGWLRPGELRVGPRLHAPRRARPGDDRGGARRRDHGVRHRARVRGNEAPARRRAARAGGPGRDQGRDGRAAGSPTAARGRSAPTARRASRRSAGCRSTCTCSTRPIRARRGRPRFERSRGCVDEGLVRAGRASRTSTCAQLDEALALAPLAAVQVALGPLDDRPLRGGVLERCEQLGLTLMAHSPLGGPKRAARVLRLASGRGGARVDARAARRRWSRSPVPAGPRPRAPPPGPASVVLEPAERERLDRGLRAGAGPRRAAAPSGRAATSCSSSASRARGRAASPRSTPAAATRGSTATSAAGRCRSSPARSTSCSPAASGASCSTTPTSPAPRAAMPSTPPPGTGSRRAACGSTRRVAQAQVNLVERLLDRFGELPPPEELRRLARTTPGRAGADVADARGARARAALAGRGLRPRRARRVRACPRERRSAGVFVAAAAVGAARLGRRRRAPTLPHLVFDWGDGTELAAAQAAPVEARVDGGRSRRCSARTAVGRRSAGAARRCRGCRSSSRASTASIPRGPGLLGTSPAHRALATAIGARFVQL